MALSGVLTALISFSAAADNIEAIEGRIAQLTGMTEIDAGRVRKAMDEAVKVRVDKGERVHLENYGTYNRGIATQYTGRCLDGSACQMTKYKTPKNQVQAWDGDIRRDIAKTLPDLSEAKIGTLMAAYKTAMKNTLKEGGFYNDRGFGTYEVTMVRAHTRRLPDGRTVNVEAYRTVKMRNSKEHNAGMKFKAAEALGNNVN